MACGIKLLHSPKPAASFHDFAEYERLVGAARAIDRTTLVIVLLGGGPVCGAAKSWR